MKKITLVLLFFVAASASIGIKAQMSLIVTMNDGSQSAISLLQLNKMTFQNGYLNILKTDATVAPFGTANIQKMTFGIWSDIESVDNFNHLQVFPNPTTGIFSINTNFQHLKTVSLTTLEGWVLRVLSAPELSLPIDITELPKGIYILKTDAEYFKIIKQ